MKVEGGIPVGDAARPGDMFGGASHFRRSFALYNHRLCSLVFPADMYLSESYLSVP